MEIYLFFLYFRKQTNKKKAKRLQEYTDIACHIYKYTFPKMSKGLLLSVTWHVFFIGCFLFFLLCLSSRFICRVFLCSNFSWDSCRLLLQHPKQLEDQTLIICPKTMIPYTQNRER